MMRRLLSGLVLMVPLVLLVGCSSSSPSPSKPPAATGGGGFKDKETGHTATQSVPNVPPPPSK